MKSGTLESAQVSTQGESLKTLSDKLNEARQKFADAKTHYGPNHPEYRKAAVQVDEIERQLQQSRSNAAQRVEVEYHESANRESMLKRAVAETKAEFDRLNARSFEYQALKREADADKSLYEELVRKIKEAGINAGFQNSSIRIADPARAALKPVFPNIKLNVLLAFLFSSLLAVGFAVLTDVLDSSVRDPEQIHTLFQTDVLGSLPMVKTWRHGLLAAASGESASTAMVPVTGASAPKLDRTVTGFEEAVRTLRNSILLGTFDRRLRSLMITSATPAEGKTTTAVHLAIAHAQQKHKTLLIDATCPVPASTRNWASIPRPAWPPFSKWHAMAREAGEAADVDDLERHSADGYTTRRAADLIGRRLPESSRMPAWNTI